MTTTNEGLTRLHDLHRQLSEVQTALDFGPKQIAARKQVFARKQAELEDKKNKLKHAKMTADQKNLQLKTNEAKIAEMRAKQNAVTSNREYDIYRGQIDADTMAKSVLEDEILEALETVDRVQVEMKEFERDVVTAEKELQTFAAEVDKQAPGLKAHAEALQAQVAEAEKFLPGDVAVTYRRLVQTYGPDALASVDNKSCSNCFLSLTQQLIVELKSGNLRFCKSCGRLLYLPGSV